MVWNEVYGMVELEPDLQERRHLWLLSILPGKLRVASERNRIFLRASFLSESL